MRPVARQFQSFASMVFKRVARDKLRGELARLGLRAGDTVYAQVSMRSVGYVSGGPGEFIGAIMDVIGGKGTLVTCAWPSADPARVDPGEVFDVTQTPSRSGLLSETLRRHAGAIRSLHPIASVVALGEHAAALTAGHEDCKTPFAPESPLGRLMSMPTKLLLVGAQIGGLLYAVQDRVDFPNLYFDEPRTFQVRDAEGRPRHVSSRLLRPLPPVVILPGGRPENRDFLLIQDYALMFPPRRERRILEAGYLRFNRSRFLGRRDRLIGRGILATGRVGSADSGLLDGPRMLQQVAKDLGWDIARLKEDYDPEMLAVFGLPVF